MQESSSHKPFSWQRAGTWALYDFANTGFAMVVLALIWPQMFHRYWGHGLDHQTEAITFKLSQATPCFLIFLVAPFLGQLAETGHFRLRALRWSVVLGVIFTCGLSFVPASAWFYSALLYTLGAIAFFCASTFYDSMIVDFAPANKRHFLSGVAYSLGFVAGLIILVCLALGFFAGDSLRWVYLAAGLWWLLFSLPLLFYPDERSAHVPSLSIRQVFQATLQTSKELWADVKVRWFLLAYILYIDGLHAVKTSAAHFGAVLGFGEMDLIKAFLVVQVIGVPAALIFGWLGNRWGAVRMIAVALVGYIFLTILGSQIQPGNLTLLNFTFPSVWLIAAGVGMVQGGVQALSRSYFAELVPEGREVVYFGFYSMMGKFAAFIGPLLGALAGWAFANPADETSAERIGFASFALLFILGLILLTHSHRVNKVK